MGGIIDYVGGIISGAGLGGFGGSGKAELDGVIVEIELSRAAVTTTPPTEVSKPKARPSARTKR